MIMSTAVPSHCQPNPSRLIILWIRYLLRKYVISQPNSCLRSLTSLLPQINTISLSIRLHIAVNTKLKAIKFMTCALLPPPKKAVLAYLGIPLVPGGKPDTPVPILRKAEVDVSVVVLLLILSCRSLILICGN